MTQPKPTTLSIRITDEMHRRITVIAAQQDRSIAYVLRQAVEEWLAKQPQP